MAADTRPAEQQFGEHFRAIVQADIRARLATAKVPRRWETVDAIPRNPTGKILKGALRERFVTG